MTILSRCFTHQVAIPLLGIEVYYFLPCSQCFQSISLSLSTELCARITFGVLKMQIPRPLYHRTRLNESEPLGVELEDVYALNAPQ